MNRRNFIKTVTAGGTMLAASSWFPYTTFGQTPFFRVGWVKQDHHTSLFVAASEWEFMRDTYGLYLEPVRERELYNLVENGQKLAEIEFIETLGASNMPRNMAQGQFDFGLGGHPAVTFFVDQGAEMSITSPLHSEGAALTVNPEFPANTWDEFAVYARNANEQIRIGYKSPAAVHPLIMERAMQYEGIYFTEDASDQNAQVLMINMKGAGNLIPGLQQGLLDGFVVNQPQPALAEFQGVGKTIAKLQDLPPPGWWAGHPCCITSARHDFIQNHFGNGVKLLEVLYFATEFINTNFDRATEIASDWLGVPLEVEQISMPNSQYSMEPTQQWFNAGHVWFDAMKDLGKITQQLLDKTPEQADALVYDFSMLEAAFDDLAAKGLR
jgi:NitT/TauT family transport system substrate-binding protein